MDFILTIFQWGFVFFTGILANGVYLSCGVLPFLLIPYIIYKIIFKGLALKKLWIVLGLGLATNLIFGILGFIGGYFCYDFVNWWLHHPAMFISTILAFISLIRTLFGESKGDFKKWFND